MSEKLIEDDSVHRLRVRPINGGWGKPRPASFHIVTGKDIMVPELLFLEVRRKRTWGIHPKYIIEIDGGGARVTTRFVMTSADKPPVVIREAEFVE